MKFKITFLLLIALEVSCRLKLKRKNEVFNVNLENKSFKEGGNGAVSKGFVIAAGTTKFVVKVLLDQNDSFSKSLIKEEQEILRYLDIKHPIKGLPIFNLREHNKNSSPHVTPILNTEAVNQAVKSPYSRILNSEGDVIVQFQYDCDLEEFIGKHKTDTSSYQKVGRLIQLKAIEALSFLHKNMVLHRDIKLENLMLKASVDKVTECADINLEELLTREFIVAFIDFGAAAIVKKEQKFKDLVGTPHTNAPEVFYFDTENKERFELQCLYKHGYGFAADVYSLAVTMLLIESKNDVFGDDWTNFKDYRSDVERTMEQKTQGGYQALLKEMLRLDFTKRPQIDTVLADFSKIKDEEPKQPEKKQMQPEDFKSKENQQPIKNKEACKWRQILAKIKESAGTLKRKLRRKSGLGLFAFYKTG